MNRFIQNIILIVVVTCILSCEETFDARLLSNENPIVMIDGQIISQSTENEITVAILNGLNSDPLPIKDAEVYVESETGQNYHFTHLDNGTYVYTNADFKIDLTYRLNVSFNDEDYRSSWQKINPPGIIDELNYDFVVDESDKSGIQFSVDVSSNTDSDAYYRMAWEETWQYSVCLPAVFDYLGNENFDRTTEPLFTCFKSNFSDVVNIGTTNDLTSNRLVSHPLTLVEGNDERFTFRYSYLLKLYSISLDDYDYWEAIMSNSSNQSLTNNTQPQKVIGNIKNVTKPEEDVVGYFSAVSESTKRVFISKRMIPLEVVREIECNFVCSNGVLVKLSVHGDEFESVVQRMLAEGMFYIRNAYLEEGEFDVFIGVILAPPGCSNCLLKGGSVETPDFWIEE